MSFFWEIKKTFWNNEEIFNLRHNSARYVFILCSLLFFLDYFFIANWFYYDFLIYTLPFTYFAFLLSLFIYSCFLISVVFNKLSKFILMIIYIVIFLLILVLSIPFILPKWIINF